MKTKVSRCLFGPVDHGCLKEELQQKLEELAAEASQKWNFDFRGDYPVPGRYNWKPVQEDDVVPKFYQGVLNVPGKRQTIPISKSETNSPKKLKCDISPGKVSKSRTSPKKHKLPSIPYGSENQSPVKIHRTHLLSENTERVALSPRKINTSPASPDNLGLLKIHPKIFQRVLSPKKSSPRKRQNLGQSPRKLSRFMEQENESSPKSVPFICNLEKTLFSSWD